MIDGARMADWEPTAMPLVKRIAAPARRTTGYAGAQISRWADFMATLEAAHRERMRDLAGLRAHSRDLAKNNVYHRRFLEMAAINMVGPVGVGFESEIVNAGKPKKDWNDTIESRYGQWGKACTVDGKTWLDTQHLAVMTWAQDGEAFLRRVRGFDNPSRYALEFIDPDRVDHTYNTWLTNGNRVIMGVEVNPWGRAEAYYIWTAHPRDFEAAPQRVRVPASDIIHLYSEDRARATRGIPWATPCMVQLNMLGRLWTSELAAANHEADRVGIIKTAQGVPLEEAEDPQTTAAGMESEHIQYLGLQPGQDIVFPTIQHPNSQLAAFSTQLLKGVASGYGVSHHSFTGDVGDANFSGARIALMDERDGWRVRQQRMINSLHEIVFRDWIEMALLSGYLDLPVADPDKVCKPSWWPRTWDWVDPQKDVDAALTAIRGGLSTYQEELGKRSRDWRETFKQRAQETKECGTLGISLDEAGKAESMPLAKDAAGKGTPAKPVAPNGAPVEAVQDTALNGAQVESLLAIVEMVGAGKLPKAAAEQMILAAFPAIPAAAVAAMLSPIKEGAITPPEPDPAPKKGDANA